jgi:hypothetical protein
LGDRVEGANPVRHKVLDLKSIPVRTAVSLLALIGLLASGSAAPLTAGNPEPVVSSRLLMLAQAGSTGGTIANQNKAVSGDQSGPGPAAVGRPRRSGKKGYEPEPRRSKPPAAEGGARASYDGTWNVVSIGSCGYRDQVTVTVSDGVMSGPGITGHIAAGGSVSAVLSVLGLRAQITGHASSNHGSGTWTRNDGCTGHWTSDKS